MSIKKAMKPSRVPSQNKQILFSWNIIQTVQR
nr:MAG TPA: hypothetical protein [Caudoviricetes sp.]